MKQVKSLFLNSCLRYCPGWNLSFSNCVYSMVFGGAESISDQKALWCPIFKLYYPFLMKITKGYFVNKFWENPPGANRAIPDFIPRFSVRCGLTRVKNVYKQLTPIFCKQNLFNFVPWFQNGKEQNFWTCRTWLSIFHSCVFLDLGLSTWVENVNKLLTPIFCKQNLFYIISRLQNGKEHNYFWPQSPLVANFSNFQLS